MSDNALLTVKQVAHVLRIRTHGVLSLVKSGQLPAIDVSLHPGGRPRWRILQEDLEGFITRRTHQPPAKRKRRKKQPTHVTKYF